MRQNDHPVNQLTFGKRPEIELYDLCADPHQLKNVAQENRYSKIAKELAEKLAMEMERLKDPRAIEL